MEAEFFLSKIQENYRTLPDVTFFFNAFLGSVISILDYLSEDYSNEFNLKIPFDSKRFKHEFNTKTRNSKDKKIKDFHKWITNKRNQIEKIDKIGSLLTQKRHRVTHRHFEPPSLRIRYRYKKSQRTNAEIKEFFVPWFKNQRTESDKNTINKISKRVIEQQTILAIDDDKTLDMQESCLILLNQIKKLVKETQEKFPISDPSE